MQPAKNSALSLLFTSRHHYTDTFNQMRARITLLFCTFIEVASLLIILTVLVIPVSPQLTRDAILGALFTGIVPFAIVMALVHTGRLNIAMVVTFLLLSIGSIASFSQGVGSNLILSLALPMLYASLVWQWRGTVFTTALQALEVIVVAWLQVRGAIQPTQAVAAEQIPVQTVFDLTLVIAVGVMAGAASGELRRALRYATRLVAQLRATSEVAQRTSSLMNLNELMQQTVNFIRDRFGFYHVQLFLIDNEQRFATLEASTSEAGEALLERGYRLAVGSQGAIGQVTLLGEPLTFDITDVEGTQRRSELLPETRSELALPLVARERIIGALDIQSTRANAFAQEDVESLGIMASLISIAISNAKIFQEQQSALNENRRLFLEAETNLREIQMLNQRLTGQAWQDYLNSRASSVVGYTLMDNQLRHDEKWSVNLAEAAGKRQPVITTNGERQVIAVPVELRGRSIGAIEVETEGGLRQSDTLEMLQSVAQRLALSVDNARLFEQAQELAQQELEVNVISARLQGASNMNDLVKMAISELSRALGARQASIRLGVDLQDGKAHADSGGNGSSNGNNGKGTR